MKVENKTKKTATSALFYVLYIALAVIFLAPLLFLFVSSVKSETQLVSDMATLKAFIPYGNLTLENYVAVFEKLDFLHYFRNSAVNAIIQVFVGMFINGMMGYALGMLEFRGQKLLVSLMIALTIIPTEAVIINRFMVAFNLGIINTIWALAIPNLATPMYVFLFYQHFRGMPKDLLEAAIIDGESYTGVFFKIMTPLSKPIYATVAIMSFIRAWGDLLWPTLVTAGAARPERLGVYLLGADFRVQRDDHPADSDHLPRVPKAVRAVRRDVRHQGITRKERGFDWPWSINIWEPARRRACPPRFAPAPSACARCGRAERACACAPARCWATMC